MMPLKLIIDTDPGCDDAMAILMAFLLPEQVEVLALTTLFGNVLTPEATRNALILRSLAGRLDVPVARGASFSLRGECKTRIADFVHGSNGLGDVPLPAGAEPQGEVSPLSAAEMIVQQVNAAPGQVTLLALASLTNFALALQLDNTIKDKWRELVVLGGAFHTSGNINPSAEANVYGDPDAADFVLGQQSAGGVRVVGLDVTHQCVLPAERLEALRGRGRFGTFIADIIKHYIGYHDEYYNGLGGCYCNDPTALAAVLRPDLFTFKPAKVRVVVDGVARGQTVGDYLEKKWYGTTEWGARPVVEVAMGVRGAEVVDLVLGTLAR